MAVWILVLQGVVLKYIFWEISISIFYLKLVYYYIVYSSCFQLVGTHTFDVKEMESLLAFSTNPKVQDVYNKYNVQKVQVGQKN
jgi:hypothetical protein